MNRFILCAAVFVTAAAFAEDAGDSPVKHMKAPKGVTLTPEQQALLDEGNRALELGYKLLMEKQDPQRAVEELRRAYVISNQLKVLKTELLLAGVSPGNEKDTPKDRIETEGGLEKIVEIAAAAGISPPAEVDNGLYKRKIVKKAADEAKKLEIEQKQLSEQIAWSGAAGGGKPQQNRKPQEQPAPNPDKPDAAQQGQPQANANQQADPSAKAQANADPNAKNDPNSKGQANADPNAKNAPNAKGEANADPNAKANPQDNANPQGAARGVDALARKQEEIAKALHRIATDLTPAGTNDPAATKAAQSFRKAADAASQTAQMLRDDKVESAAVASKQVERAIGDAQAAASASGQQRQAETLAAIQNQIDALQDAQQRVLGQTNQIHKNADGSGASEAVQKDRAAALAIEQGKLKPQLENVQKALAEMAENNEGGGAPNSAQNAAREETANALNELQKGRSKQAIVNATMKLANGDPANAATSMAQVQAALNAARQRVAAANNALAGNNARLEQEYRQVQQLAAALRRIEKNAQDAGNTDGKGGAPHDPKAQNNQDAATAAKDGGDPSKDPGNQKEGDALSASMGAVLNHSAEQINADLEKLAPNLASTNAEAAKQIGELAGKKTNFERDREGSLAQVRALLGAVEKVEVDLAKKVAGDDEKKALRNYRKDEIPLAYRKAVASYYEDLSKDEKK